MRQTIKKMISSTKEVEPITEKKKWKAFRKPIQYTEGSFQR